MTKNSSASPTGVFICDVMGHGVRSAMITSMLRALVEELQCRADAPAPSAARRILKTTSAFWPLKHAAKKDEELRRLPATEDFRVR
jgi:Stage II sporulation protein E (SpoIIE)